MTAAPQRVAVITGAGSGIGAAVARRLAGPGIGLLLHTGSNKPGLDRIAGLATAAGAATHTIVGDLGEPATAQRIADACSDAYGRIDVLVCNAGFAQKQGFGALDEATLEHSLNMITKGFFRLVTAALPQIAADARIVATSSFLAHAYRLDGRT